jgi:chorismate dehydratase
MEAFICLHASSLSLRAKLNHLRKIKVGAVSYLNTKPLLYGVKRHPVLEEIELVEAFPAKIAQMLIDDELDMGLIPVGIIPKLKKSFINGLHCIGCEGPVASVCIFSEVPMEEVDTVYLDYQSRTSVLLAQILLKEFWTKDVRIIKAASEDYRKEIRGKAAGLVIGDRALEQRMVSSCCYDLGEAWMDHTGLPFVFAAWISNKELPQGFISRFDEANAQGLDHLDEVIIENQFPYYDLGHYFTKNISYSLTAEKRKGLELFLQKIRVNELK